MDVKHFLWPTGGSVSTSGFRGLIKKGEQTFQAKLGAQSYNWTANHVSVVYNLKALCQLIDEHQFIKN